MIKQFGTALLGAVAMLMPLEASAGSRYGTPPPLTLSSDLSSPWTLQLQTRQQIRQKRNRRAAHRSQRRAKKFARSTSRQTRRSQQFATASVARSGIKMRRTITPDFNPDLLPTVVDFLGNDKPGTLVVNTPERRLYLVLPGGKARRYAIGVGKPGFEWSGIHKVSRKSEWPDWRPPKEMIARERKKGRELPAFMPGGPKNPLGARALYLGSSLYRIHGTNQAWSIGKAVSSGCIRMRNQDVMDLYDRIPTGTRVRVI